MARPARNLRTILVPYDGSRSASAALQAALQLATGSRARLKGLFVVDSKIVGAHFFEDLAGAAGVAPFLALEQQSRRALGRIGKGLMAAFAKACAARRVDCDTAVVEDSVADGILAAARRCDLVVLGQRGARRGSGLVGADVERVVRHSPVPVLMVPEGYKPVRRILAGYDGSAHGRETLGLALAAASWFSASLTVLHVSSDADGKATLQAGRRAISKRHPDVKLALERGDPASTLARLAHKREYDLLVLGAYGHGFLREFLLGSTTDLVLRETRTPLLIHR